MKELFNYGYFRIEKQQVEGLDKNEVVQSILLNQEGLALCTFDGDVMVKEVTKSVFFLVAPGNAKSLFIKNTEDGISMHEFDYINDKLPFIKTNYLIDNDLMVVNHASCDYLFSISEGKIISDGYDAITEKNENIIISIELENGNYSGILNLKGDLINCSDWFTTQKKNLEEPKLDCNYQGYTRKRTIND